MRVSLGWLDEMVPVADIDAAALAERLTGIGLEVDDIWRPRDDLDGVVAVRILNVERHPGADTLSVCTVTDGEGAHRVVCGAPGVRPGMVVPWAPPGTVLPGGTVERRTIRGQESAGMLCSADELGWGDALGLQEGLWELPESTVEGTGAAAALGLDDVVLELDLTPNYAAHCQSILGVARELSAALERPMREAEIAAPLTRGEPVGDRVTVRIEDEDLCPRYTAMIIDGVTIGPSPWPIQRRLLMSGVRPHNVVVDITNYVMLERGQPLHAFDLGTLDGGEIAVRRARDGETIVTLDGRERRIEPSDLVIADRSRPVAVAGVMGGLETEVGDGTGAILLESASFSPSSVRRTATRMGLRTDASGRFEKGLDVEGTASAALRAAGLLCDASGGSAAPGVVDVYPRPTPPRRATLRPPVVTGLLGLEIAEDDMTGILTRLGCQVEGRGDSYTVTIPSWRVDLELEVDLVEEIARHHGYDRIPATVPQGAVAPPGPGGVRRLSRLFRAALLGAGLDEVVTYAFSSTEILDRMGLPPDHSWREMVPVVNPLARWQEGLRTSLVPGFLACARTNHQNREEDLWLFEIGKAYVPEGPPGVLPAEPWRLVVLGSGRHLPLHWATGDRELDLYDLKGVIEKLLDRFGPGGATWERARHPWLHPGRAAEVRAGGEILGWAGELHPDVVSAFDLTKRAVVAEMDLDIWWTLASDIPRFSEWGRFPAATRDLALVVDEEVEAAAVEKCLSEAGSPLLESVVLFDVYRGVQVSEGQKSLAYSLTYRAGDRTLTDDEVDSLHQKVREAVAAGFDAELRS